MLRIHGGLSITWASSRANSEETSFSYTHRAQRAVRLFYFS